MLELVTPSAKCSLNMLVTAVFSQGVVFLNVMSGEEYDPLVLNANRPAPLKVGVQYDPFIKTTTYFQVLK